MSTPAGHVIGATRNLQGRRHSNPLISAARIVGLLIATFASLAGGVWYSSSAACKTPCRIDGTLPRMAALGQRDKIPGLPEHNARPAREEPSGASPAMTPAAQHQPETVPPATTKVRETAPRPAAGMRTDLPPPVKRDDRWKEPLMRGGNVR
jgi:hypothetical protein